MDSTLKSVSSFVKNGIQRAKEIGGGGGGGEARKTEEDGDLYAPLRWDG